MKKAGILIAATAIAAIAGAVYLAKTGSIPSYRDVGSYAPTTDAPSAAPAPSLSPTPLPVPAPASSSAREAKEFTVIGTDYAFSPSAITVKKGEKVRIVFKNENGTHDLRLDEFGVAAKRIRTGEQETVEFTADKAGSFEYYCSIGSHRQMGMKGTLMVQ